MAGLRLDNVTIAGVCDGWTSEVPIGHVRGVVLADDECARAMADVLLGFRQPDAGTVLLNDRPITPEIQRLRTDGVRHVPASGALFPHLTVLGNIAYAARRDGKQAYELAKTTVRNRAASFGLDDVLHRFPHEITIGRRKLAGLMRVLRHRPALIVLEDAADLPRWGALLATTGFRPATGRTSARTPELLAETATVLLTTRPRRSFGLDNDPIDLRPEVPRADGPA